MKHFGLSWFWLRFQIVQCRHSHFKLYFIYRMPRRRSYLDWTTKFQNRWYIRSVDNWQICWVLDENISNSCWFQLCYRETMQSLGLCANKLSTVQDNTFSIQRLTYLKVSFSRAFFWNMAIIDPRRYFLDGMLHCIYLYHSIRHR